MVKRRRYKKLLFAFMTIVLFFVIFELVMRLLVKKEVVDVERLDDRVNFMPNPFRVEGSGDDARYKVVSDALVPAGFPVNKPESVTRIFIVGASFAMGRPYVSTLTEGPDGSIATWMRTELELLGLGDRYEIINAAGGGMASPSVKDTAIAACDAGADVLLVAMGNNEGANAMSPFVLLLNNFGGYRWLKKQILREPNPVDRPEWFIISKDMKNPVIQFQKNLLAILDAAEKKNVTVALASLPVNLSGFCTVDSKVPEDVRKEVVAYRKAGQPENALNFLETEPNSHWKYFQMGWCMMDLGRFEEALDLFEIAAGLREFCGIYPPINDFEKDLARKRSSAFVDLDKKIRSLAPEGITGQEQFYDSCHLFWQGYAHCADEVLRVFRTVGIVPKKPVPWKSFDEKLRMMMEKTGLTAQMLDVVNEGRAGQAGRKEMDYWVWELDH